jgi:outer membrane protein assembly factor BamB
LAGSVALLLPALMTLMGAVSLPLSAANPARIDAANPVPPPVGWGTSEKSLGLGVGPVIFSSPTLADLDGNGSTETIFVGSSNGHLLRVDGSDGSVVWSRSISSVSGFNQPGCTAGVIRSSPAVGMLRAPAGSPVQAVAVGVGDNPFTQSTGGVIAFRASDGVPLWHFRTGNYGGDSCSDGVVSSPTVTDVDKDGDDEVLFGSFDHGFYILNNDGTAYPNWPQWFLDTHWSSPAVGDIDRDGQNEIIVASDEGRTNPTCPYPLDWGWNYCGGSVYAMRLDGARLSGFPYYTWQIIQSQPALADLNQDGYLDIIFGTGAFYAADTAASNYDTFRLFAIDRNGNDLPGWPVNLNGTTEGEPAVGDINGDGDLEVVMGTGTAYCFQTVCNGLRYGTNQGVVFAFNHTGGAPLWSTLAQEADASYFPGPVRAPLIADSDSDGQMEVVFSFLSQVLVLDGATGAYEIGGPSATRKMRANETILSAAAVSDINGDGKQEIVAASALTPGGTGAVYAWKPSDNTGTPNHPWPMFRRNAAHTGRLARPIMQGGPAAIVQLYESGRPLVYTYPYPIQNLGGDQTIAFATSDNSSYLSVQPASTTIASGQTKNMTVTVNLTGHPSLGTPGSYLLGRVTMTGTYEGVTHAFNSPKVITVTLLVGDIRDVFLPLIQKASP